MYELERTASKFETYCFRDEHSGSWFSIVPERGGIVTSLGFQGRETLYLDEATLVDEKANVRGGIPVLFPISGQLENGSYEYEGTTYHMKNHGVARTNPWTVEQVETGDEGVITVTLTSNEQTKMEFPFDFSLQFTYRMTPDAFTIEQTYSNLSDQPMPIYAGLHPYFRSTSSNLSYQTDATRMLDYNTMEELPFSGQIDMSHRVESVLLLDAKNPKISFQPHGQTQAISLAYGPEFRYIVLWTQAGKEFICVEPWMAKNGALNSQEGLIHVQPASSLQTYVTIRTSAAQPVRE